MNWYIEVFKKYAVFEGRARRTEYWMFQLFNCIFLVLLTLVESATQNTGILIGLYVLVVLLPNLSVTIRRLHDTNRSGWWFLISFLPVIGPIILLVFMAQNSVSEENQYGENPKIIMA